MKPLVPALLSLLLCSAVSLRAQVATEPSDSLKELKKKYANGGQKPEIKEASATETAPVPGDPGMPIADLEALLLRSPECTKNPGATAELGAALKGRYALVFCRNEIDGLQVILLVPKSASVPGQQLRYGSIRGFKLLGARLVDHYFVIEFDKQTQYLDLIKTEKDPQSDYEGFVVAGFVVDDSFSRFEDMGIFIDALKRYGGVRDQEMLSRIPASTAKLVNGKRFRMSAGKVKGEWVVVVTHNGGQYDTVWPEAKKP